MKSFRLIEERKCVEANCSMGQADEKGAASGVAASEERKKEGPWRRGSEVKSCVESFKFAQQSKRVISHAT